MILLASADIHFGSFIVIKVNTGVRISNNNRVLGGCYNLNVIGPTKVCVLDACCPV